MKSLLRLFRPFHPFCLICLSSLFLSCQSSTPKEQTPAPSPTEIKGITDSLHGKRDTTVKVPVVEAEKEVSTPRITDRICNPNVTLLAKPAPGKQIFYVTGFDEKEFKCWEEIMAHATRLCGEETCTLYYVDAADVKVIPGAKDLMDPATLKEHGVAKFAQVNKIYNFNGASIWKRKGNGWAYYNTNNQAGG